MQAKICYNKNIKHTNFNRSITELVVLFGFKTYYTFSIKLNIFLV